MVFGGSGPERPASTSGVRTRSSNSTRGLSLAPVGKLSERLSAALTRRIGIGEQQMS